MVTIKDNKISENPMISNCTGIYIYNIYGVVSIADNDIGAWEDDHGQSYFGNSGQGIFIQSVFSGAELTIGPDNSIKDNTSHGIDISWGQQDSTIDIHNNSIVHNGWQVGSTSMATNHSSSIIPASGCGIKLGSGGVCGAIVSDNTITNHHTGIHLDSNSTHNTIQDNEIRNNGDGIWIEGDDNQILRNDIRDNEAEPPSGIHLTSLALGNIIQCNNIVGNLPYGIYNENDTEDVDAASNWWGDASGPSGAGTGDGDAVSEDVNYSSWLPKEFQDCPECMGAPPPPQGVPTVTHWGMAAMIALFAGLLVWTVKRRRHA